MAIDLTSHNEFPYFHNFTAGDASITEIKLPDTCSRVSVGSQSKALYVTANDATDGGAIPTHRAFIPAANYLTLQVGSGLERICCVFVASQSGNANVSVILEET